MFASAIKSRGRGKVVCHTGQAVWEALRPTDPLGVFTLTLTNVVVGSRVNVSLQVAGTTLYDDLAAASTVVITLSGYTAGSANNDLRIKVRKGSAAPYYKPYETLATASVGAQLIYVSQIPD
jgi:hypothetical protein